jgi:hypothetical protein
MNSEDYSKIRLSARDYVSEMANKQEHINQLQSLFFKE